MLPQQTQSTIVFTHQGAGFMENNQPYRPSLVCYLLMQIEVLKWKLMTFMVRAIVVALNKKLFLDGIAYAKSDLFFFFFLNSKRDSYNIVGKV